MLSEFNAMSSVSPGYMNQIHLTFGQEHLNKRSVLRNCV